MRDCARSQISSAAFVLRSVPQIITRKMPGGNALSCRRHAEISLEAALRRGGCPSVASQALTRPEFASYTARMRFDARRWTNAVTIGWLIAERMGMDVTAL